MARWFLLLLTGCSLTLSGPDPNRPRNNRPACDTSKAMVALDGALAATLGLVAIGVASNNNGGAAVAPALIGSLFLLSAIHGNSTVDSCNREMASFDAGIAQAPEEPVAQLAPPAMAPPQMPPQVQPPVMPPSPAMPAPQPAMQPVPPVTPPHVQAPAQPAPAPRQDGDDPWSAFWREVP